MNTLPKFQLAKFENEKRLLEKENDIQQGFQKMLSWKTLYSSFQTLVTNMTGKSTKKSTTSSSLPNWLKQGSYWIKIILSVTNLTKHLFTAFNAKK